MGSEWKVLQRKMEELERSCNETVERLRTEERRRGDMEDVARVLRDQVSILSHLGCHSFIFGSQVVALQLQSQQLENRLLESEQESAAANQRAKHCDDEAAGMIAQAKERM